MPEMINCKKCQMQILANAKFCHNCGATTSTIYTQTFNIGGMSENVFIDEMNRWFANNRKVANVTATFDMKSTFGLFANEYILKSITLKYELFKNNNENQYGIDFITKTNIFKKPDIEQANKDWEISHSNCKIISSRGGTHSRGKESIIMFENGFGSSHNYKRYVLFRFKGN